MNLKKSRGFIGGSFVKTWMRNITTKEQSTYLLDENEN